jgi:Fic family protein
MHPSSGTLTDETVRQYYGEKRFEQVAESNALEGSTLDTGETELAVLKGITITGHDPAFIKDAQSLDKALQRLTEIAKNQGKACDISEVKELHTLILEPRGGIFRDRPVAIRGSQHRPPKTWAEVMEQMEAWEKWSLSNGDLAAPIRAAVLHAWFAHIHPFSDGNGRTARAISNLELIRQGYPPIIIKKTQRSRYLDALSESGTAGDIKMFLDLILEKVQGALTGLENSARQKQGYDEIAQMLENRHEQYLKIWLASISLLAKMIEHNLQPLIEALKGSVQLRLYDDSLDLEDFEQVCSRSAVARSWAFQISLSLPGHPEFSCLAYYGFRSSEMYEALEKESGPSLFWSFKTRTAEGSKPWTAMGEKSPFAVEITTVLGKGDEWRCRFGSGRVERQTTSGLAENISRALIKLLIEC